MSKKTHNSKLAAKVALRMAHIPEGKIRVLDLYHGMGTTWKSVQLSTGRDDITIDGLDLESHRGVDIVGDNTKILPNIDLDKYDVIDMDSYGVPFDVAKAILARERHRDIVCFYTFIQTMYGKLPNGLLYENGYTKEMINQDRLIYGTNGHSKWLYFLAKHGVTEVSFFRYPKKVYGSFVLRKNCRTGQASSHPGEASPRGKERPARS